MAAQLVLTLSAFAKINLDLRVLGVRPDGYHDLRTVFQSLAVHDMLTFTPRTGRSAIECDDPDAADDRRNLVWKAASLLWRTVGRRRGDMPRDVVVRLRKRVPAEGRTWRRQRRRRDGAARAVATVGLDVDLPTLSRLAARIGADVPFFLVGGTALGLGRGDDIYPLADLPRTYVVIVRPQFGVVDRRGVRLVRQRAAAAGARAGAPWLAAELAGMGARTCATTSSPP